jgi:DNA invertase Pin-like site-specific DNA recombinase
MSKAKKPIPATRRAAIYCRVSTYNQGQGDYSSLNTQEDILKGYAKTKGWEIYDIYVDTKTGTTTDRIELQRMLSDASGKKFDIVLSTKLDRISRSMKDFFEINDVLIDNNIDLVLATQNIDTTSSMGRFNRNMLMAFAEFERDMIAERTREKLYSQAQKGYWGGGHAPLGYQVKDKKLVVVPEEADLVRTMLKYYLEEPSSNKVSERLNNEGYTMKTRTSKSGSTSGGTKFAKESVIGILRNTIYTGVVRFKKELFEGIHEAIVDKTVFQKVQDRLSLSARDTRATSKTDSPLTLLGITKCGHCESLLSTSSTYKHKYHKRIYYYKCSKAAHHTKTHCSSRDLPAEDLERLIMDVMRELVDNNDFLSSVATQLEGNSGKDMGELQGDLTKLKGNLSNLERRIENLIIQASKSPVIKKSDIFDKAFAELENQRATVTAEVSKKERELEKLDLEKVDKNALKDVLSEYIQLFKTFSTEQKRRLNQIIFSAIVSTFVRGKTDGYLDIHIRGDGTLRKTWEDLKKSPQVRTSGGYGSGTGSITRTLSCSKFPLKSEYWNTANDSQLLTPTECRQNWASTTTILQTYKKAD